MRKLLIAFGVLTTFGLVSEARADQIDRALVRNSDEITKAVRGLGGKYVAVLKFDVTVGGKPSDFQAGLGPVKIAQKVENLLVLTNDLADPLFVLTDAGVAASKLPANTSWRTPEGRKALAGLKQLPLAWDDQMPLTPTAFVAGELQIDADFKTSRVVLYGFTTEKPDDLKKLYTTPAGGEDPKKPGVVTDRGVLALAGVSFALSSVPMNRRDGDGQAVFQAAAKKGFGDTAGQSPVKLEMVVNEVAVVPQSDPSHQGSGRVQPQNLPDPKKGDTLYFRLTNTSADKTYAVLLAVNGRNTNSLSKDNHLDAKDPKDHRLWVLAPKESVGIRGYYTDSKGTYAPFKVLGEEKSQLEYAMMSGDFRGLITLHVFGERTEPLVSTADVPPPKSTGEPDTTAPVREEVELSVLSLGVGGSSTSDVRSSGSLEKAKKRMQELAGVRPGANGSLNPDPVKVSKTDRGLIVESESRQTDGPIQVVKFKMDPNYVAFLQIRYYAPTR